MLQVQVCKSLRFSGVSVPRDYEQGFQRALWTFQHQRVWCPLRKQLVHLHPLPQGGLAAGTPRLNCAASSLHALENYLDWPECATLEHNLQNQSFPLFMAAWRPSQLCDRA